MQKRPGKMMTDETRTALAEQPDSVPTSALTGRDQCSVTEIAKRLSADGLAYLSLRNWTELLGTGPFARWRTLTESWDSLGPDIWMTDGGTYRRRNFATYAVEEESVIRKPHQAHRQSRRFNRLTGGMDRWFSPIEQSVGSHELILALLSGGRRIARRLTGHRARRWHAEVHQIRIQPNGCSPAFPTPEGLHRDGVVLVLMMLIARSNVRGGITLVVNSGSVEELQFDLSKPCEGLLLDDRKVLHEVSPVWALDPCLPAHRDILILTFRPDRKLNHQLPEETRDG